MAASEPPSTPPQKHRTLTSAAMATSTTPAKTALWYDSSMESTKKPMVFLRVMGAIQLLFVTPRTVEFCCATQEAISDYPV